MPGQWNQNYATLNGSLLLTALVVFRTAPIVAKPTACAAAGLVGRETDIFRKTLKYSMIMPALVVVVVLLQAFVVPWCLPFAPAAG